MNLSDICIVVHGTINDYNVMYRTSPNVESCILCDIRKYIKNDYSVINKDGILMQVAPNGMWISKFMILLGECKMEFIAFSVYVPNGYRIQDLNKILEDIKNQYLDKIKELLSNRIIDLRSWYFIDKYVDIIKCNSIKIKKSLLYRGGNNDKYVYVDSRKINENRFLKHIYQQEYANYDGVFLGNEVLNEGVSMLVINLPELKDVEYSIEWKGKQEGFPQCKLPLLVRESHLSRESVTFVKDNYEPTTINLKKDGIIERKEECVYIQFPSLKPCKKIVKFNPPKNYYSLSSPHIILCSSGIHRDYRRYEFELKGEELKYDYIVRVQLDGFSDFDTIIKSEDLLNDSKILNIEITYKKIIKLKFGKFINNHFFIGDKLIVGSELEIEDHKLDKLITLKTNAHIEWSIMPKENNTLDLSNMTSDKIVISNIEINKETLNKEKIQECIKENHINDRTRNFCRHNMKIIIILLLGIMIGFILCGLVTKSYNVNCSKEGQNNNWNMYLNSKNER